MQMNQIIREKRRELGLTQEQVADRVGVSAPAVNKWEKGVTYPDILSLPALARLLNVDLNELFCFHDGLSEQEIRCFLNELIKTAQHKGVEAGFAMAEEKIREYPNCLDLVHKTALTLDGSLMMSERTPDEKRGYEDLILSWYERAAKSEKEDIRVGAAFMASSKYLARGEDEKAGEMAELVPERNALDRDMLKANICIKQEKPDEAAKLMERALLARVNEIQVILIRLVDSEIAAGESKKAALIAETGRKASELFGQWECSAYIAPMEVALAEKNEEESISLIKAYLSSILKPWHMREFPLYDRIGLNDPINLWEKMLPPLVAELENSPKYDFMRDNEDFLKLVRTYRAKCEAL